MSTTNDEQAKYGEQPNEREPMLSNDEASRIVGHGRLIVHGVERSIGGYAVRDFYEHLITTGKLRVVEEVDAPLEQVDMDKWWTCSSCKESFLSYYNPPNYCPGCGNKIKR